MLVTVTGNYPATHTAEPLWHLTFGPLPPFSYVGFHDTFLSHSSKPLFLPPQFLLLPVGDWGCFLFSCWSLFPHSSLVSSSIALISVLYWQCSNIYLWAGSKVHSLRLLEISQGCPWTHQTQCTREWMSLLPSTKTYHSSNVLTFIPLGLCTDCLDQTLHVHFYSSLFLLYMLFQYFLNTFQMHASFYPQGQKLLNEFLVWMKTTVF